MAYHLKKVEDDTVFATSETEPLFDALHHTWRAPEWNFYDADHVYYVTSTDVVALAPAVQVSPVEFKLLFTSPERVAIKAARATDPFVADFFEIVEDPRLTHVDLGLQSTKQALAYLASKSLIADERQAEILKGVIQ